MKIVKVVLMIDRKTWCKEYENVSSLFMAYPYVWQKAQSGEQENMKMLVRAKTKQPFYYCKSPVKYKPEDDDIAPSTKDPDESLKPNIEYKPSIQKIFCTMYDPSPINEGDSSEPIYTQDPLKAIQFFGTREDCFRLNPDAEPTEVSELMYLDSNGFIIYPDPDSGKVNTKLSPKVKGYIFKPMDFTSLHFPIK